MCAQEAASQSLAALSTWEKLLFGGTAALFAALFLAMFILLQPHGAAQLLGEPLRARLAASPPLQALAAALRDNIPQHPEL